MRADLHMHSVWSDGAYTPQMLARACKQAGVGLFSVTDHDTMGASAEAARAASEEGLRYLRGWEVSSYRDGVKLHILGYACREGSAYSDFAQQRAEGALLRAEEMRKRANAYLGLDVGMEEIERFRLRKQAPLHTMHIVFAFAARLGADAGELYRTVFAPGCVACSSIRRPSPEEAIDVIHASGGVALLAHPGRIHLPFAERERLMEELFARGLEGVECAYPTHTAEEEAYFRKFTYAHGGIASGGSDFHDESGGRRVGEPAYKADERLAGLAE